MNGKVFLTVFFGVFILIGIESAISYRSPIINGIVWILKAPVVLFEYYLLLWYWGGDGVVTLISIPLSYSLLIWLQFLLLKKYRDNIKVRKVLINSMIFYTPILSVAIAYLIAFVFGFEIGVT